MAKSIDRSGFKIKIHEPLAKQLQAPPEEIDFALSLLDVARFSGHCCVAVTGAFLVTQTAVDRLFPDGVCIRGDVLVEIPTLTTPSATGPVANVISYITGAWGENGFKGLNGEHSRKDLLRQNSTQTPAHTFLFVRKSTGAKVTVRFDGSAAGVGADPSLPFAERLNVLVNKILSDPGRHVSVEE